MTDRWTAETYELVRDAAGVAQVDAAAILDALADAGLLLAPGGETYQDGGCPGGSCRNHDLGKHTHRRTLRVWPDGSRHYGPWVPVSDGGEA
jgi:hypothetical protein